MRAAPPFPARQGHGVASPRAGPGAQGPWGGGRTMGHVQVRHAPDLQSPTIVEMSSTRHENKMADLSRHTRLLSNSPFPCHLPRSQSPQFAEDDRHIARGRRAAYVASPAVSTRLAPLTASIAPPPPRAAHRRASAHRACQRYALSQIETQRSDSESRHLPPNRDTSLSSGSKLAAFSPARDGNTGAGVLAPFEMSTPHFDPEGRGERGGRGARQRDSLES